MSNPRTENLFVKISLFRKVYRSRAPRRAVKNHNCSLSAFFLKLWLTLEFTTKKVDNMMNWAIEFIPYCKEKDYFTRIFKWGYDAMIFVCKFTISSFRSPSDTLFYLHIWFRDVRDQALFCIRITLRIQ